MKKLTDWVKDSNKKKNYYKSSKFEEQLTTFTDSNKSKNNDKSLPSSSKETIDTSLKTTLQLIKTTLGNSTDIVIREFSIGTDGSIRVAILYTDGLADKTFVQDFILKPLIVDIRSADLEVDLKDSGNLLDFLKYHSLDTGDLKKLHDMTSLYNHLLSGDTILLLEGHSEAITISSRGWADRGVQEPSSQTVVRGPKDGFSETLRTNTALIRRRIKDPSLWIETFIVGKKTKTDVAIVYLKGVATDSVIKEVKERIKRIDVDSILEGGYIEEFIQDETYTPFPTVYNSERPDAIAGGILEGRVAIIVDGTPFVLLVPALFVQFLQSTEDYYQRTDIATMTRLLRFISFLLSLLVPSAYIAVTTFHQEMLPTTLLVSLAAQREGVPFPAFVEAVLMEVTFEILREAGVRMPRAVGSAISIVGALVLGQAAVEAGIVSAAMVIVVSLTAISSFVSPQFNMSIAVRLLRFGFMLLAASFGLFGIIVGLIAMVLHMCSLRSFGVPYLTPLAPFIPSGQKDTLFRLPHWALYSRPRLISQQDTVREQTAAPSPNIKGEIKEEQKESEN
ncbi:spore germination protein [Fredinandcohnia humi]